MNDTKEPSKHSGCVSPMLEDEKTILATSINWWILGGVLVNIILLILILCI